MGKGITINEEFERFVQQAEADLKELQQKRVAKHAETETERGVQPHE